jgi:hypothetical protein
MSAASLARLAWGVHLTPSELVILQWVEANTPRRHHELWARLERIADELGIHLKTVQRAFRRFRAAGLVALRRDYRVLDNRRAYVLRWRAADHPLFDPKPADLTGHFVSDQRDQKCPVRSTAPSLTERREESGEERTPAATAGPPPPISVRSPEPSPEPEPARIAAETAAQELTGRACARKIDALLERGVPLDLIAAAIERAADKKRRGKPATWGLVWTLALAYRDEGGPEPLPPRRPHATPSPRVVPPADEVPVEPIDWSAIVADMEAEGRGEAAKVIHRSVSRAPAGGRTWQGTPRPTCRTLTAHHAWHYTVRSEHEDDGARTRNLRRDRPDVSQHGAQETSGLTSLTFHNCQTPTPEPQIRPEPEIRSENPRALVAALAAALACSARVPHSGEA